MEEKRIPLIAGNWKMNLDHLQAIAFVQKLAWALKDKNFKRHEVEVCVLPPFTDLRSVQTLISADDLPLSFGAQDLSAFDSGAYTGEVSGIFLRALNCSYAVVGHSERREYQNEGDTTVAAKCNAALRNGLVPILCVGETLEDLETKGGSTVPVAQLSAVLDKTEPGHEMVVAYEPVWAIGSGKAASADQADEICGLLRQVIAERHGEDASTRTRILYGGSVNSKNIAGFMKMKNIDGALVGGASIDVDEFVSIVRYSHHLNFEQ